jgi:hypothetical protein
MTYKTIADFFKEKPETYEIFKAVKAHIDAAGPHEVSIASQISFGAKRKFVWVWLYNVTKKNPNGILHLMLAIDQKINDPHIRAISQISKNRWNHQIVIRTLEDARSIWLKSLIEQAYQFGNK